jgi:hypothetical protein
MSIMIIKENHNFVFNTVKYKMLFSLLQSMFKNTKILGGQYVKITELALFITAWSKHLQLVDIPVLPGHMYD